MRSERPGTGQVIEDGPDDEDVERTGDETREEGGEHALLGKTCGEESAEEDDGQHEGDGDLARGWVGKMGMKER